MDPDHVRVDEEDKKCGVRQVNSEESVTAEVQVMLPANLADILSFVKMEEPSMLPKNSECAQNTGEEISNAEESEGHITNPPSKEQPPLEQVVDVNNSLEVNGSVPKTTDVIEVRNIPDKSNEKGTDDVEHSGDKTEVGNIGMTCFERVNHSESATANNDEGDENTVCTETKQVKESEEKIESVEARSAKRSVEAPTTTSTGWDLNVLLIGRLPPARSGVSEIYQAHVKTEHVFAFITTFVALIYSVSCKVRGLRFSQWCC
jgi:hypothetical protein